MTDRQHQQNQRPEGEQEAKRRDCQQASAHGRESHPAAELGKDGPAVPRDSEGTRQSQRPARKSRVTRQPDGEESLADVQHEDERAGEPSRLSNRVGGRHVTRTRVAHVHAFDEARDP